MSWWVYLENDGGAVTVERHAEGGTFALGGVDRAELNVTYNYGARYREALTLRDWAAEHPDAVWSVS